MHALLKLLVILTLLISYGCNLWSGLDQPSTNEERYIVGRDLADQGECAQGRDYLRTIGSRGDKENVALGWALMCVAGVSTGNIASTLYNYTSSSTTSNGQSNLIVIGNLARTLSPMTEARLSTIDEAITAFQNISNPSTRAIEVAIAQLVKSAAILSHQAKLNSSNKLVQTDIADAGCSAVASDCVAGCTATASGTMSDADIATFANTISASASALSSTGAGNLSSLASAINARLAGATNSTRCFIYKEMIPSDQ